MFQTSVSESLQREAAKKQAMKQVKSKSKLNVFGEVFQLIFLMISFGI